MALPLTLRNGAAVLILESLHDPEARRALALVAAMGPDGALTCTSGDWPPRLPGGCFEPSEKGIALASAWAAHARELAQRCRRAVEALGGRALDPREPSLRTALAQAAVLFDAGLYFEVHELLEPYWLRASGIERETVQGLIQIAVGFQHLANGNVAGARALLHDGSAKTLTRRLCELDLDAFARDARGCLAELAGHGAHFDWHRVPRFPTGP